MKILNFGSLNIDHVYRVEHFVRAGETLSSRSYARFIGGKGNNQSVALARAGAKIFHAGVIGSDGVFIRNALLEEGVDCRFLEQSGTTPTGHAMIQVNDAGENCILLYGGTNLCITEGLIRRTLNEFESGDFLVLQNEINSIGTIMTLAAERGMRIFFNPAPMGKNVFSYPLELVDTFIVNEIEGSELAGCSVDAPADTVMEALRRKYPDSSILMTLGSKGSLYLGKEMTEALFVPAQVVKAVDTTAAGDTFIGYFLAGLLEEKPLKDVLRMANAASAITVTRPGAAASIPFRRELQEFS